MDNPDMIQQAQHVVVPDRPQPHTELIREADGAIGYLHNLASSPHLNADLRIALNNIQNTIKNLRATVLTMDHMADDNHEKLVSVIKSQRLI